MDFFYIHAAAAAAAAAAVTLLFVEWANKKSVKFEIATVALLRATQSEAKREKSQHNLSLHAIKIKFYFMTFIYFGN